MRLRDSRAGVRFKEISKSLRPVPHGLKSLGPRQRTTESYPMQLDMITRGATAPPATLDFVRHSIEICPLADARFAVALTATYLDESHEFINEDIVNGVVSTMSAALQLISSQLELRQ